LDETEAGYPTGVKRISCIDEVLERALAHAREDHDERHADRERRRTLVTAGD
jgi:hypothetical protein